MRAPSDLAAALRASGRKVTPQRLRIFEILHDDPSHPTAESVHARVTADLPSVSLRTVYATLHDLTELGELQELALGTGSTRFDPNVASHHHLVCRRCGGVTDLPVADQVPVPVENPHGFHVEATEIVYRGTCAECASREMSNNPSTPT